MRILKYRIDPVGEPQLMPVVQIDVPGPARPLSVGAQVSGPVIWFSTGDGPLEAWTLYVVVTGAVVDIPADASFVGTTTVDDWIIVHVFAKPGPPL